MTFRTNGHGVDSGMLTFPFSIIRSGMIFYLFHCTLPAPLNVRVNDVLQGHYRTVISLVGRNQGQLVALVFGNGANIFARQRQRVTIRAANQVSDGQS